MIKDRTALKEAIREWLAIREAQNKLRAGGAVMERRTYLRRFANGDTQKLILLGEDQEAVRNYRGDFIGYEYFYRFRTPSGNEIRLSLQAANALTPCEASR